MQQAPVFYEKEHTIKIKHHNHQTLVQVYRLHNNGRGVRDCRSGDIWSKEQERT